MTVLVAEKPDLFDTVQNRIKTEVGDDVFNSWFTRVQLEGTDGDTVRLSVPTLFLKSWINSHYSDTILLSWQAEEPAIQRVELSVRGCARVTAPPTKETKHNDGIGKPAANEVGHPYTRSAAPKSASLSPSAAHEMLGGSPLEPRYTLETFVVGRSNTLAHAAAKQVAEARRGDLVMFNPLYIHAGVGLGKTHLLHAIVGAVAQGERKVLYLTAEKFMYGFVTALKTQTTMAFKEALRGIDVLVIDDLQFLSGKNTQAEFCHTLNALMDAGRQVVIAADRPPTDLETLDERVRSRLAGGLTVEMGHMGEELRLEVLKSRVEAARVHHPLFNISDEVLKFVAKSVTSNGRSLDGALNQLLAHSKLTGQPVTLEVAEKAVRDLMTPQEPKRVKIEDIQRVVARQYNVSRSDLLSSRRTANVIRPRHVAMYLAKVLTMRSLPEIGRRFGGRDHTTVLHAVSKIEGLLLTNADLAEEIELLKRQLAE